MIQDNPADTDRYDCENCGLDLTDPKNAGFRYGGDWFCSGYCADAYAGFWAAGESVNDYNSQLSDAGGAENA